MHTVLDVSFLPALHSHTRSSNSNVSMLNFKFISNEVKEGNLSHSTPRQSMGREQPQEQQTKPK